MKRHIIGCWQACSASEQCMLRASYSAASRIVEQSGLDQVETEQAVVMGKQAFVFEVSEASFAASVLQNSEKIPVLVEFMGVWSEPCVVQADMFAMLAHEFAEQFVFARVDIDEQQGLRKQYHIENVPTLMVFQHGKPVRTEVGQLSEAAARTLLKDLGIFRESDAMREEARAKHLAGDTPAAVLLLTQAIQKDPANTRVAMDMVQILIDNWQVEDAQSLFERLPEKDQTSDMGKALKGQLLFLGLAANTEGMSALQQRLEQDDTDHAARFDLALCQVAEHQYRDAMDNLFAIMQSEADFRGGAAKEMISTLANMLAPVDMELAQEYRRRLANLLAK